MTPHPYVIADICHRLRVATHTAKVYLSELSDPDTTKQEAEDIIADLRGYLMAVTAGLDALHPIHAVHVEPEGNVVEMAVWPRPAAVRAAVPLVVALEQETKR